MFDVIGYFQRLLLEISVVSLPLFVKISVVSLPLFVKISVVSLPLFVKISVVSLPLLVEISGISLLLLALITDGRLYPFTLPAQIEVFHLLKVLIPAFSLLDRSSL